MIKIQKKFQKEKVWKSKKCLNKSPSKIWFRDGFHSLVSRAVASEMTYIVSSGALNSTHSLARGSADIIYRI